jgi:hypothetical protein
LVKLEGPEERVFLACFKILLNSGISYAAGREVYTGIETTWKTGVDRKIILKCIFKKWDCGNGWTGLIWLRTGLF